MNEPYFNDELTSPKQHGPIIPFRDARTRSNMARSTWWVRAPFWQSIDRGSVVGTAPGFVVEESEPRCVGADVIEYDLLHAELPAQWFDFEPWVYNFQYVLNGSLVESPVPVTSRVIRRYVNKVDPSSESLEEAFRFVQSGGLTSIRGKLPTTNTWILGEDEQLARWMGDIWEITRREVFYTPIKFLT